MVIVAKDRMEEDNWFSKGLICFSLPRRPQVTIPKNVRLICRHKEQDEKLEKAIVDKMALKRWPLPGIPTLDSPWARMPTLLAALGLSPLDMQAAQV